MKTTKEMIEVMQAYADGKKIERIDLEDGFVSPVVQTEWNWAHFDYRIKPEQTTRPMTLDEIIEWRYNSNGVIQWTDTDYPFLTTVAVINKDDKDDTFYLSEMYWCNLEIFLKYARKSYGEKFEVEL